MIGALVVFLLFLIRGWTQVIIDRVARVMQKRMTDLPCLMFLEMDFFIDIISLENSFVLTFSFVVMSIKNSRFFLFPTRTAYSWTFPVPSSKRKLSES